MKVPKIPLPCIRTMSFVLVLVASCAPQAEVKRLDDGDASFARVKPVLERNCVHCHADNRLPGMPSLTDTMALSRLIGTGNFIVPGKPEQSRFFVVATLSDNQVGAMPPTGHGLDSHDTEILKDWIRKGARLPQEPVKFQPKGTAPRSR